VRREAGEGAEGQYTNGMQAADNQNRKPRGRLGALPIIRAALQEEHRETMKKLLWMILAVAGAICAAGTSTAAMAQDAKAGESKASMCLGCHNIQGYQASFPEVYRVPMISGQKADYIVAALNEYKKGDRKHPTMRAVAGSLTDKDIADLAAFYEARGKEPGDTPVPTALASPPPANVAALLQKGNCISCHGANFDAPLPGYPRLSGQHPDYLFQALRSYQVTNLADFGRGNAIMAGMVRQYTHAELQQIAEYIGTLPSELKVAPQSRFR
jgi:cytochrome c553